MDRVIGNTQSGALDTPAGRLVAPQTFFSIRSVRHGSPVCMSKGRRIPGQSPFFVGKSLVDVDPRNIKLIHAFFHHVEGSQDLRHGTQILNRGDCAV